MGITGEKWEWSPEELEAMPMEELLYNLARVVLRIGDLTDRGDVLSLQESSVPS